MMFALAHSHALPLFLLEAAPTARMASARVLGAVLLVVLLCGLLYVLLHLRGVKPQTAGPGRNNTLIFIGCAIAFAAACLLLFLMAKA